MNHLPSFFLIVLCLMASAPRLGAQPASVEKNRVNLEIDRRLGWIGKNAAPPKAAPAAHGTKPGLPNYFTWESSRFMQPGPPPYSQQPENIDDVSLAFALSAGELPNLPSSQLTKVVQQVESNPAIRDVVPHVVSSPAAAPENFVLVETSSGTVELLPKEQAAAVSAASQLNGSSTSEPGVVQYWNNYGGGVTISSYPWSHYGGGTLSIGTVSSGTPSTSGTLVTRSATLPPNSLVLSLISQGWVMSPSGTLLRP